MSATATETAEPDAAIADDANRSERETWRLVLAVTIPFWIYLALMRTVVFMMMTAGNPGIIIAPPHLRLLQHAVLLPLLVLFYRWALAIDWPERGRVRAFAMHATMALAFALLARPVLVTVVAASSGDWTLMQELVDSVFGWRMSLDLWVSTGSDFLLSYVFGLAILLGVKNFREVKYQKLRAANLQSAFTRSRLQALRMQLNPHFLFNSLNAAVFLIGSRPAVAEQMLVRLSELLRRTLRDGEPDLIPATREADFIRNYLDIQHLRFPDRLTYNVWVEREVENAAVPSLLLQPLAENAVQHGMAADNDRVHVEVRIQRAAPGIELTVRNTAAEAPENVVKLGVGLGNTRERLETLYGKEHEFALTRETDGSVLARVRIPWTRAA
jgi:two-component system, LytTR family, sensor kinase